MADPISVSSGIAGLVTLGIQVTGVVYSYLTAVKDKSKNVKELHDELVLLGEVLNKLQYFLASSAAKANRFDEPGSTLSKAISACKERVERIGDKLKPKDSKLARAVDRLVWPFKEEEVQKLMESLRRYRSTFEFAASIQGYEILSKSALDARAGLEKAEQISTQTKQLLEMQGLHVAEVVEQSARIERVLDLLTVLESAADDVKEVSHAMRLQEIREQERRKTEILEWLCPLADLHKHKDVQARRAKGTGKWLLETSEFKSWTDGELQDLLCIGPPGVGKSVLCSLVVDELRRRYEEDTDTCVVHYYFDYAEQQLQTDVHFARSILRQLCVPSTTIPEAVAFFYQKTLHVDKDKTWFQQLQTVIRRVLSTYTRCYLVLDALDETDAINQRTALFEVLDIVRADQKGLKVLATSRPHLANIGRQFPQSMSVPILADPLDLRQYLSNTIDAHPDSEELMDDDLKRDILDKLVETAGGMFLLPSLHIRNILDLPSKGDVRDMLDAISTDLTNVFDTTIARIRSLPTRSQEIASKALLWVSHSRRPLTMPELRHALAIRSTDTDISDDRLLSPRRIIDYCCGLIEHETDSDIVHLVHFTLKTYLQSRENTLFEKADLSVVRSCLTYMRMDSLATITSKSRVEADLVIDRMTLSNYACLEWGSHAKELDPVEYADLALPILNSSQMMKVIARIQNAKTPDQRKWHEKTSSWAEEGNGGAGINLVAGQGLTALLRLLISQYKEPNLAARNVYGSTALHEAALHGHEGCAEVLIAHGADLFAVNHGKSTPFHLAVSYGRLNMARCLLRYDMKQLTTPGRGGAFPLHKAVELGSDTLTEFLLSSGADVNLQDDAGNTALHEASLRGFTKLVRMLVLAGATIEARNKLRLSPLDQAATGGHTAAVEFLIENGANVLHQAQDKWSALHRAARGGHIDTMVLLLEAGANVLSKDHKHHIPLHHAARSGHLESVMQLLEYNPALKREQLFRQDKAGATPRETAYYCARYDVHKYLRSLEWELLGTTTSLTNRVTLAIEQGDLVRFNNMLENGEADLEILDEDGQAPMHVAVQEGQLAIAQMLIQRGASIEKIGYHGWRPLHIAASLGDLQMVAFCLDHGADVHSRTDSGQQAIHKAASAKSMAVMRRLIRAGADIEVSNGRGMTPLLIAAHANDTEVVRALVQEYRADVLARDKYGIDAATWAERGAHLETAKYLRGHQKRARERHRGVTRRNNASSGSLRGSQEELVAKADSTEVDDEEEMMIAV